MKGREGMLKELIDVGGGALNGAARSRLLAFAVESVGSTR